jgi:antitoxin component YwqK of YwqJK toxin-antitoxin module
MRTVAPTVRPQHYRLILRLAARGALSGILLLAASAARAQPEQCSVDGRWINLNHGGMLKDLTGLIRCTRDGKTTREIPYLNGKVHGVQRVFGRFSNPEHVIETEYRDGKRNGIERTLEPSGRLVSEVNYLDDRERGVARHYYPSGKLQRESDVADDERATITHKYDEAGRLAEVTCGRQSVGPIGRGACRYRNHNGVVETFWPSGAVRDRSPLMQGLIDGTFERRSPEGLPQRREDMKAGILHGKAITFYSDGKPEQEAEFRDGVRHGSHRLFHSNGVLLEELVFEQGALVRERTHYLNGELRADTERDQDRVRARGFWDNGKPRYEATYHDPRRAPARPEVSSFFNTLCVERNLDQRYNEWGALRWNWPHGLKRNGMEKLFFEDGTPAAETTFRDGRREGPHRRWHANGKLAVEAVYAADRVTAMKEYDETGRLVRDEEYLEDGSRKRR